MSQSPDRTQTRGTLTTPKIILIVVAMASRVAPLVGAVGLGGALFLTAPHHSTVTTSSQVVDALTWLHLAALVGGLAYAHSLQRRRPHIFDGPAGLSPYLIEASALPDELHGTDPTDH